MANHYRTTTKTKIAVVWSATAEIEERNKDINRNIALNKMVTTSLSLVSNEDMSYFPSVQPSLVMTMVMLISTFTMTVHLNKKTLQLDTNERRLVDILWLHWISWPSVFSGPRPKKKELGQYRAILTAPLVNIPFLGAIAQSD